MKIRAKTVRRSLRFESLERRAMLSSGGFQGVAPALNTLNNFEGPAAYGVSIARNSNLFVFTPVLAIGPAAAAPASSAGGGTGRLLNSGVLVTNAANQVGVLGTDIELASGSLSGAELGGIQLDLQALAADLNGAASGTYNGPISVPIDILAGVTPSTSAQVGEIVQAIQGTFTNVANDIQSIQGGPASPFSDVSGTVGGLSNAFQSVLHNVNTLIGASIISGFAHFEGGAASGLGNPFPNVLQNTNAATVSGIANALNSQGGPNSVLLGLGGINGGLSGSGNLPFAVAQSPLGSLNAAGVQLNVNSFGTVL